MGVHNANRREAREEFTHRTFEEDRQSRWSECSRHRSWHRMVVVTDPQWGASDCPDTMPATISSTKAAGAPTLAIGTLRSARLSRCSPLCPQHQECEEVLHSKPAVNRSGMCPVLA